MHRDMCEDEKLERITDFLSQGLGFSSKNNAWAGPDHWKFRKIKGIRKSSLTFTFQYFICIVIVEIDHNK